MNIIRRIESLYYKTKHEKQREHFNKYKNMPPEIYYDIKYDVYVHPSITEEYGSCSYVASELTRSGCIYHFCIGKIRTHSHGLDEVYLLAYNKAKIFSINEEDEKEYSEQELDLIKNLIDKGKLDRKV